MFKHIIAYYKLFWGIYHISTKYIITFVKFRIKFLYITYRKNWIVVIICIYIKTDRIYTFRRSVRKINLKIIWIIVYSLKSIITYFHNNIINIHWYNIIIKLYLRYLFYLCNVFMSSDNFWNRIKVTCTNIIIWCHIICHIVNLWIYR